MRVPENYERETDIRIELQWNDYDTGLLTQKLYRHVRKEDASFQHEAEPGSLIATYGVAVASGVTVTVIAGLGRYLLKRIRRAAKDDREVERTTVIIYIEEESYEITVEDEEDVEEIRRLAERKVEIENDRRR